MTVEGTGLVHDAKSVHQLDPGCPLGASPLQQYYLDGRRRGIRLTWCLDLVPRLSAFGC